MDQVMYTEQPVDIVLGMSHSSSRRGQRTLMDDGQKVMHPDLYASWFGV